LPLGRLVVCRTCHAQLHVCRMCEFFDPHLANQCREPVADFVQDKERANFCGYFRPRIGAYDGGVKSRTHSARDRLDDLFGLAKDVKDGEETASASAQARKKLEDLFKK